ncbi:hypothetical protein [Pectinatus frisingensis]|uniref:hypothetical protein n=1 Tax=Pectinatus frisingensis TaxID=865 RepID=UPI003D80129B
MAKNTGNNYRRGEVRDRSQTHAPNGNAVERNTTNGQFTNQKTSGGDFKGVRHEGK